MKLPRRNFQEPGSPWSRLAEIAGTLASGLDRSRPETGQLTLTQADAVWLSELLNAIMLGEDISRRFFENRKPSPQAERHFWMACDYAQHRHDDIDDAAGEVAKRWGLDSTNGTEVENVRTVYKRMRQSVDMVRDQFGPGFAHVIEWHRSRFQGAHSSGS